MQQVRAPFQPSVFQKIPELITDGLQCLVSAINGIWNRIPEIPVFSSLNRDISVCIHGNKVISEASGQNLTTSLALDETTTTTTDDEAGSEFAPSSITDEDDGDLLPVEDASVLDDDLDIVELSPPDDFVTVAPQGGTALIQALKTLSTTGDKEVTTTGLLKIAGQFKAFIDQNEVIEILKFCLIKENFQIINKALTKVGDFKKQAVWLNPAAIIVPRDVPGTVASYIAEKARDNKDAIELGFSSFLDALREKGYQIDQTTRDKLSGHQKAGKWTDLVLELFELAKVTPEGSTG